MNESLPPGSLIALQSCARGLAISWRDALGNTTFSQESDLTQQIFEALSAAASAEFERRRAAATECRGGL